VILHLAAFTWTEEVDADQVRSLTAALEEMAAGIPQLLSYRCGENLRLRPGGADYAVAALVADEEALSAYLDSAAHADVYERLLGRMIATRAAAQLEIPDGGRL
jgi:hypothetical protein